MTNLFYYPYFDRFSDVKVAWRTRSRLHVFLLSLPLLLTPFKLQAEQLTHRTQQEVLQFLQTYAPEVVSADRKMSLVELGAALKHKQVVFVGEQHNRYDHHLNQLAILRLMHQQNRQLAIGVEWFQQSFQSIIDDYLAGTMSETELLQQSGYYERWGYDYRLLRPVMEYAREHDLPVVALNAPAEITRKVSAEGLAGLSADARKQIPSMIHPPQEGYKKYLREVFDEHMGGQGDFDRFLLIQRIWDETMAANIVSQLTANPQQRMIVFAGSGHIGRGTAIPGDVSRSFPVERLTTLHSVSANEIQPGTFDYFILSEELSLPPTGKLGVWLEEDNDNEPYVALRKLAEKSAAADGGMLAGDRFISFDGQPVKSTADLLSLLADTRQGQAVDVEFSRAVGGSTSAKQRAIMKKSFRLR